MAKKSVSDAEFERQYEAAVDRGRRRAEGLRAVAVFYDEDNYSIILEFSTKGSVEIPRALLDELEGAAPEDLAQVELSPQGIARGGATRGGSRGGGKGVSSKGGSKRR